MSRTHARASGRPREDWRELPHNLDAECATLGAGLLGVPLDGLTRDCYSTAEHRVVFDALAAVRERGETPDLILAMHELTRAGTLAQVGGAAYLASLVDGLPRVASVSAWAPLLREAAQARRRVELGTRVALLARDPEGDQAELLARLDELRDLGTEGAPAIPARWRPLDEAELLARQTDAAPRWLVSGLLPVSGSVMFHGRPRAGKTYTLLALFAALAAGRPAFDLFEPGEGPQPVLFISGEDSAGLIAARLRLLLAGFGLSDLGGRLHVIASPGLPLEADPAARQAVLRAARSTGARVVGLSSVRALFPSIDGSPRDAALFCAFLRELQAVTPAVALDHHDTKAPTQPGSTPRQGAERASGGLAFSITDCPISVENLGPRETLLRPNQYKLTADPSPFKITWESEGSPGEPYRGFVRPVAALCVPSALESGRERAAAEALRARVLATVRERPGLSGRGITEAVRPARAEDVRRALAGLLDAGHVDQTPGPDRARLWIPRAAGAPEQDGNP